MVDYYLASYDSVIKAMIPKIKISYNNIYIINLDRLNILSEYLDNEIINHIFLWQQFHIIQLKVNLKTYY